MLINDTSAQILLCAINAKYIHTNIAVRLIKEYCEKKGVSSITLSEYTINNYAEDIITDIYLRHPDVVAFSCYIWNIELIKKVCTVLKKIIPELKIILGGPEVTYNSSEILTSFCECDIVIIGEGEQAFYELCTALREKTDLSDVCGISYKNSDGQIITNDRCSPLDMSELPFPYSDFSETENKICYYEASRGCPFKCQYCLSSVENGVRFAPVDKVKKELMIFIERGVKQVKFVDRTFNSKNDFAIEIVKFLIKNDNQITNFHFEVAAELLTDELISLFSTARCGLFQLEIGVQSTNTETLKVISRKSEFNNIVQCVNKIISADNIHIHLDLIAGLPMENIISFKKSFNDVYSLRPHQLQLGFLKILHGSGMEKLCEKYEIKYSPFIPYEVLSTDCLSFDDIVFLKQVEDIVEKYYNSNRFVHAMDYLVKHCGDPFKVYSILAGFKKEFTAESITHNKNDAYRFLLDAAEKFDGVDIDEFIWVLKFDYILHERPKGIPEWTKSCINILTKDTVYDMIVRQNLISYNYPSLSEKNPKALFETSYIEKMPLNPITFEKKETTLYLNYNNRDLWGNAEFIYKN